jgi:hypothetical protein
VHSWQVFCLGSAFEWNLLQSWCFDESKVVPTHHYCFRITACHEENKLSDKKANETGYGETQVLPDHVYYSDR